MVHLEPFPAVRFNPSLSAAEVLAPPYDVLSDADVDRLQTHQHNITHIDVPRGGPDRYSKAAALMRQWLASGTLVAEAPESFTIYRMSFTDATGQARQTSGVFGGLAVVDPAQGGVLPHERTTPKASTDRLDLTVATAANLSAVWVLSLASGLTDALAQPGEPLGGVICGPDGMPFRDDAGAPADLLAGQVHHQVERVTDPARIAAIKAVIGSDDVLIADGHHRYGVARQYKDQVRAATGRNDSAAEYALAFVNELSADQLSIEAIHRLYSGVEAAAFEAKLAEFFDIAVAPAPTPSMLAQMETSGRLVLLRQDSSAAWLTPKPRAFQGVRALDGAYLEHALSGLGVQVTYQHGLSQTQAEVTSGRYAAGIVIRPTSITEIIRTAREGLLMPPKSTFFSPKLLTGWVIRQTAPLPTA
ncbi:MAG: DUF1015 domain-containing protein [Micrococcales bacterium]|nr:DUF1015 domain-containing protein [Micrococcales bacterium]